MDHDPDYGRDNVPLLRNILPEMPQRPQLTRGAAGIPISLYCVALYFFMEIFDFIIIAPLTQLFEEVICRQYYEEHVLQFFADHRDCKIAPIQSELAIVRGWKGFFDALPVFFVAIPLGMLSDRHGRKPVLTSSILSTLSGFIWIMIVCYFSNVFPIRLVWLSSAMYLFGGGIFQANASVMLIAAESSNEENRSRTMYYIYSSYLVTELVAPSIAAVAINKSLWLAFGTGVASLLICFGIIPLLPDTRQTEIDPLITPGSHSDHAADEGGRILRTQTLERSQLRSLLQQRNILLALPIFVIGVFRPATLNVLLQYTSIRFHWTFARAALLTSEVAGVSVVLFLIILPFSIRVLQDRFGYHSQIIDLRILQLSLIVLCIGATLIGLAPNSPSLIAAVFFFAIGFGCRMSVVALTTSWVPDSLRAQFFGAIQVFENIGLLISDPIMQGIFAAVLKLPNAWLALPFFVVSGLYLCAAICSLSLRIPQEYTLY